ncbi:unnamed protein product [Thelazia callipaeda]|uniref:Uncharacterized protein n=1 Tax=Thelazia callipaeda TaxID=103827 RepID=A0A0N5CJE6_THECL|nr:unnamed protein product [Thelazia callipaeda]
MPDVPPSSMFPKISTLIQQFTRLLNKGGSTGHPGVRREATRSSLDIGWHYQLVQIDDGSQDREKAKE